MFPIIPMCTNATHATGLLFHTATASLQNGTSIISFYFCLLFEGKILTSREVTGLWNTWGRMGEESISGPHNKRSSNSLLLNATDAINLSILKSTQRHFCHTRRASFDAERFQAIRAFSCDNLHISVILMRTWALWSTHIPFIKCQEPGPNIKTAYGKAWHWPQAKRTGKSC